jgi:cell division protein FtsQ
MSAVRPSNRRTRASSIPPDALEPVAASPTKDPVKTAARSARWAAALRIARTTVGFVLILGVSLGVAWGARRYVNTSPRFAVRETVVDGTVRRSKETILQEGGIAVGDNVFAIDLDAARRKLEADPWIAEATLARRLPDTILVQVKERDAAAVVALGESYLVSRDGEVFKKLEPGDPSDLPIITGIDPDGLARDREGTTRTLQHALDLAGDYAQSSLATKHSLQELHVDGSGNMTLVVGTGGVSLALGAPPYRRKLEQAWRVLVELDRRGVKPDAVLLDNEARPERVVARVK